MRRRLSRRVEPVVVPTMSRRARLELITAHVDLKGLGLEFGPSHNPLLSKADGFDIRIADYLDRDGLLEKYEGLRPTHKIEEVDYVLTGGRLTEDIPDRFDYIVASHVIEHTVCLICFLEDCAGLLRPGGALTLAIPDRRYCFDRFRDRTALGRVIDVHKLGLKVHSEGSVIEHYLFATRKGEAGAWSDGSPGTYKSCHPLETAVERGSQAATGEYVDTHNWVFTPSHFRLMIHDLRSLGLVTLQEKSFTDTIGPEFYVTLSADGKGPGLSRDELQKRSANETSTLEVLSFA